MTKLWGGRFTKELAPEAKKFSYSLLIDQELFVYDIQGTIAHIEMLGKVGILKVREVRFLTSALYGILENHQDESLDRFAENIEDVHSLIYTELQKKVGALAKKIHSGRSRNDQVVTAVRLYLKDKLSKLIQKVSGFQKTLLSLAVKNEDVMIPGYTHLQRAQVILMAHHLLAYIEMLERDKTRLQNALLTTDELPLGSGALSGSTLPLDREMTRKSLRFSKLSRNSLDAISSRDFLMETLAALSILMVHLSRLSEDFILWNSTEFGFITLRDDYATGSSLMPQKKNPDIFELTRGKTGSVIGDLVSILTMMKGLPMSYNRDMQEDKAPLFHSLKTVDLALEALTGALSTLEVNRAICEKAVLDPNLYATDFVDYLVEKGVPFKEAHDEVGQTIQYCLSKGKDLKSLTLKDMRRFAPKTHQDIYSIFSAKASAAKKKTIGSTSPASIAKQIAFWKKALK